MKDESSQLAVQPVHGFQRGLGPEAAMGQRCRLKWGLRGCRSCPCCSWPPRVPLGLKRGTQEGLELGCRVAVGYPISPMIFMARVGFAGFLGLGSLSEPPQHLRGCCLLWLGAVKLRCRRWPRSLGRCWHRGRLFWERRGKCLAVSRAVLQAPASPFLAGREIEVLHWESCCVWLRRSPLCRRGGGLSGMGGSVHPVLELLRGDVHPREAREVLGSGRKPCPGLEMPLADPTPAAPGKKSSPPVTGQRPLIYCTCDHDLNPSCPKTERLCLELGTASNGKQGIVSRWIPHSLNSSHSRQGSKHMGTLVQPPWCQVPSVAQDGVSLAERAFWAAKPSR